MTPSDTSTTSETTALEATTTTAEATTESTKPTMQSTEHVHVNVSSLDKASFLEEILKSRRELLIARQQFEQVSDPLLIDHVVFRIGAAERHLNYLFKLAREQGITFEGMQWEWQQNTWKVDY